MNTALHARFRSELSPLFTDLPSGSELALTSPAVAAAAMPADPPASRRDIRPILAAAVWLCLLGVIIWSRGHAWWLLFFAGGITGAIYRGVNSHPDSEKRIEDLKRERKILKEERKLLAERRELAVLRGDDLTELDRKSDALDAALQENREAKRRYE